jgi:hypothetical protein
MKITPNNIAIGIFLLFVSVIVAYLLLMLEAYISYDLNPSNLKKYYLGQYFQFGFLKRNLINLLIFFFMYSLVSTTLFHLLRRVTKRNRIVITILISLAIHLFLMIGTGLYDFTLFVIIIIYLLIWVRFISRISFNGKIVY